MSKKNVKSVKKKPGRIAAAKSEFKGSKAFGLRVAHARNALGLVQGALAKKLGCAQPTLSQIESGRANPGKALRARIEKLLGVK